MATRSPTVRKVSAPVPATRNSKDGKRVALEKTLASAKPGKVPVAKASAAKASPAKAVKAADAVKSAPVAQVPPMRESDHPSSLIDLWLGERLRLRRKELRMPLQQVADACGISVSLLSQIERGLRSISLRTLNALSRELDVQPETLVMNSQHRPEEQEVTGMVTRAGHHPCIENGKRGIMKENLTPASASGAVGLYRAVIEPGGSTGPGLFTTDADEQVGYVVEGQLELFIGDQLLMLKAGDSFVYHGETPRRWRNPGKTVTTVVWGISAV